PGPPGDFAPPRHGGCVDTGSEDTRTCAHARVTLGRTALYGDHFRSPGRDDRQDGTGAQQSPWEAPHAPAAPANEDVKVAGSPTHARPGQDPAFYDAGAHERTERLDESYGPPTPVDGNPVVTYDMGAPQGEQPPYGQGGPSGPGAGPY